MDASSSALAEKIREIITGEKIAKASAASSSDTGVAAPTDAAASDPSETETRAKKQAFELREQSDRNKRCAPAGASGSEQAGDSSSSGDSSSDFSSSSDSGESAANTVSASCSARDRDAA